MEKEVLRIPGRVITEKAIPKHIMVKLLKNKDKEKTLKLAGEEKYITFKRIALKLSVDCSTGKKNK